MFEKLYASYSVSQQPKLTTSANRESKMIARRLNKHSDNCTGSPNTAIGSQADDTIKP